MTPKQISKALADPQGLEDYYAVQGMRRGVWNLLFAPYLIAADATAMRDHLASKNPACQYQAIRIQVLA